MTDTNTRPTNTSRRRPPLFPGYLDVHQCARRTGYHPETLRELLRAGRLPGRLVHGKWLIPETALEALTRAGGSRP